MDHIGNYFSRAVQKIVKHKFEKDIFCEIIFKKTGIELLPKDFSVSNGKIKLKILGPKRTKILSIKESILCELKENNITAVSLE